MPRWQEVLLDFYLSLVSIYALIVSPLVHKILLLTNKIVWFKADFHSVKNVARSTFFTAIQKKVSGKVDRAVFSTE